MNSARHIPEGATDLLFVRPSFLRGVARAFDLWGVLEDTSYMSSPNADRADAREIQNDWRVVGNDLWRAASQPEPEELERRRRE